MTCTRTLLVSWTRSGGIADGLDGRAADHARRAFAYAVSRNLGRAALPGAFNAWLRPLTEQIRAKGGKDGPIGKKMQFVEQLRVLPDPCWNEDGASVQLIIVFLPNATTTDRHAAIAWLREAANNLLKNTRYRLQVVDFSEMADSAAALRESDTLDLDYISRGT